MCPQAFSKFVATYSELNARRVEKVFTQHGEFNRHTITHTEEVVRVGYQCW